jgi:hypothetical protein
MIRVLAAAIVWPPAAALTFLLFMKTGPDIEAWVAPVLVDQQVEDVVREGDTVCWRWKFTKTQWAQPRSFAWSFTVDGTSVEYPAVVFRGGDQEVIGGNPRHRDRGPGEANLCARIPTTLAPVKNLKITGEGGYMPAHRWWVVPQELPDITVPPATP